MFLSVKSVFLFNPFVLCWYSRTWHYEVQYP